MNEQEGAIYSARGIWTNTKKIDSYITILEQGETTVSTVAEEAGGIERHVYNIAVRPEERNFIEMIDFVTPARLRAVPPERIRERQ